MVHGSVVQSTLQNPGVFVGEVSSLTPGPLDPASNYQSQGDGFIRLMYEGLKLLTQLLQQVQLQDLISINNWNKMQHKTFHIST